MYIIVCIIILGQGAHTAQAFRTHMGYGLYPMNWRPDLKDEPREHDLFQTHNTRIHNTEALVSKYQIEYIETFDSRMLHFLSFLFTPLQIAALEAAAAAVVNALRLDNFAPGCAENPKLQRHYAAIQALGLTRDISWYRVEPDGKHERLRTTSRMLPVPQTGQKCWIYFGYTTILHTVFRLAWASESQGWIHAANIETYETGDIIMPQCASAFRNQSVSGDCFAKRHGPFAQHFRRSKGDAWYAHDTMCPVVRARTARQFSGPWSPQSHRVCSCLFILGFHWLID